MQELFGDRMIAVARDQPPHNIRDDVAYRPWILCGLFGFGLVRLRLIECGLRVGYVLLVIGDCRHSENSRLIFMSTGL